MGRSNSTSPNLVYVRKDLYDEKMRLIDSLRQENEQLRSLLKESLYLGSWDIYQIEDFIERATKAVGE